MEEKRETGGAVPTVDANRQQMRFVTVEGMLAEDHQARGSGSCA